MIYECDFKIFPKSNHFFSHNKKILKGIAFNVFGDNAVVMSEKNSYKFLDGGVPNPKIIRNECFTKTGSGKTSEDLKLVIDASISFFKSKLN